jgi:nucleoside-diphosphate-sugar epimerase
MTKKNILITGGAGFIGTYLRNHYQNTHTVYAPERSRLDLTNAASVDSFFSSNRVDVVIHTALIGRNNINGVDPQQAEQNIAMFVNLWRNRHRFEQFINMGTGNEFDTTTNIDCASEDRLFNHLPMSSYAYAKNIVARICRETENFTNLRLFGVFHHSEQPVRFFRRVFLATQPIHIFQDHQFDYFNLDDFPAVIDTVINRENPYNDINIAYKEKYLLSELAGEFMAYHKKPRDLLIVDAQGNNNFTGDTTRLDSLNLKLQGLAAGFVQY